MKKELKLIGTIRLFFVIAFILFAGIFIVVHIEQSHVKFDQSAESIRNDFVAQQKVKVKLEVDRVVELINYRRGQIERQTRDAAKQRVYQAYAIAVNIYQQFRATNSPTEIKQMILAAIRGLCLSTDNAGFFILSPDGTLILSADQPQREATNQLNLQDAQGRFVIQDMLAMAEHAGEGSYAHICDKPSCPGNNYPKISYVKDFVPYGWIIGAGLYVADVEKQLQSKLLAEISQIRFGKEGYIFVYSFGGDTLSANGKIFSGDKKMWQVFDQDPDKIKLIFNKLLRAALKPNGDYSDYTFQKLTAANEKAPKVSFIYGIRDWQWLVGAGVYLDDVDAQIALLQAQMTRQIHKDIKITLFIALILLTLFLALFHLLGRWILKDCSRFVTLVEQAVLGEMEIDSRRIRFSELRQIADDVNILLQEKLGAQSNLISEKERLRTTLNSIGDAVIVTDIQGKITSMNPVAEQLTDWLIAEAHGQPLEQVFNIVNTATRKPALNPLQQVLANGKVVGLANHTKLIARNGREYHIADSAAPIHAVTGVLTGVVLVFRDVSDEYYIREQLCQSELRYRTFFENSVDPMLIIKDGIIIDCNRAAVEMLGYRSKDDLLEKKPAELSPEFQPDGEPSVLKQQEYFSTAITHGAHRFEWDHMHSSGAIIPIEVSLAVIPATEGTVLHTVWRDISAHKSAMMQLKHQAHHHPLTGLPNRLLLGARLEHSLQYAKRDNSRGAVLFLDLDDFKKINDSLGHSAGDSVLKIVAERLQEQRREIDTVAHISGDEFVIVMQKIHSVDDAILKADQILSSMQQPFAVDGYELFIGCSVGIVEFDSGCDGMEDLLKKADAAMYKAKAEGKNCYQLYESKFTDAALAKVMLEGQLRHALELNELVVYYQPQVELDNGNIVAVEALMRWQHPELGLVAPDNFIPLSEETGLIVPMGEWIMRRSCEQLVAWRKLGFPIQRVAVNLSGKQLQLANLPQIVQSVLEDSGCPAQALELEITEGFIMRHPEQSIAMLQQIRDLGVELSVDDFGTGHSSLNYLKQLPINRLKIDCSFVWDIGRNASGEALVNSIVDLGHSLGLSVIAEGIETVEQKAYLDNLNCDEGQGYLFSKPRLAAEISAMLAKDSAS
jgi:diguanylate cyclase (GGDEF)-like protein/PAS domain S-box-containing protein